MHLQRVNKSGKQSGFTMLELVMTLTVMSVVVLATVPLAQNAVKRQKEIQLRETLRQIRSAIDEFKRDTIGACPQGAIASGNPTQPGMNVPADPRSRVVIDDCKIFTVDNLDRFPPDLETLVKGVRVKPRGMQTRQGSVFDEKNATEIADNKEVTKVYLREMPIDPITGKDDWVFRSSYQEDNASSWDEVNLFDVRSASDEESLSGEKYSDW